METEMFQEIAPMMSGPSLLHYAKSSKAWVRAIARGVISDRIRAGMVDDIDHDECEALGLV